MKHADSPSTSIPMTFEKGSARSRRRPPPSSSRHSLSRPPLLTLQRISPGQLSLAWTASCNSADSDYEIYEGTLGSFTGHVPLACSTGGNTSLPVTASSTSSYYLVVPRSADREGSHGANFQGERPRGRESCLAQSLATCN